MRYLRVIIPSPPYSTLTYGFPAEFPDIEPGTRVLVSMGRSLRVGVAAEISGEAPEGVTVKPVLWPLDAAPLFDAGYLAMVHELAVRQMVFSGKIFEILLPGKLRTVQFTFEADVPGFPRVIKPRALGAMPAERRAVLARAWHDGGLRIRRMNGNEEYVHLNCDPPWQVRPNAERQIRLLDHLLENGPVPRGVLGSILGHGIGGVVDTLARHGLVTVGPPPEGETDASESAGCPAELQLTPGQEDALEHLLPALHSPEPETHLLHGVTGSGKTHVYFELADACMKAGKSVVILAPEVALAGQLHRRAQCRFPDADIVYYHGYLPQTVREKRFLKTAGAENPVLVIGARSSLFLPVRNLGLMVLDEEHDESFKQEERLAYQAKEIAWFRIRSSGGLLVLGSATPDVKTFYAAQKGRIPVRDMPERTGPSNLPDVRLADISSLEEKDAPFAPEVREALKETLDAGEQVIILLNRRGYSPLMFCRSCREEGVPERGAVVRCPHCDVGMTFHKARERLVCHYCGHVKPWPLVCSKCGGSVFLPLGEGTERLEERLNSLLPPETSVLRLDRDSTRRQDRMEAMLKQFSEGSAQVMVGTQMLSKGHHFPGVTLVVAVDGDLGLNLPDYRSMERTFQLLVQVSGRAGRGERPGRVIIQTRTPGNPFWDYVVRGDYRGFYDHEIELREKYRYPPFVKLGLIRMSFHAEDEKGPECLHRVSDAIRKAAAEAGIMALGPAPAPLGLLRGRRRFNCLLKGSDWLAVRNVHAAAVAAGNHHVLRLSLDLDPVNMM